MSTASQNKQHGKDFEQVVLRLAPYSGLLIKKYPHACQIGWRGKLQLVFGELDYRISTRDGQVGFFDCKSFGGEKFSYSALNPNQLEEAVLNNEWMIQSGFIVYFREMGRIVKYYTGQMIAQAGPRSSFRPQDGISLGRLETLDLKLIFAHKLDERGR